MVAAVITLARMRPDHHVLHRECLLRTVRAYLTFSFGVVGYTADLLCTLGLVPRTLLRSLRSRLAVQVV
jgi:hypothetical protein